MFPFFLDCNMHVVTPEDFQRNAIYRLDLLEMSFKSLRCAVLSRVDPQHRDVGCGCARRPRPDSNPIRHRKRPQRRPSLVTAVAFHPAEWLRAPHRRRIPDIENGRGHHLKSDQLFLIFSVPRQAVRAPFGGPRRRAPEVSDVCSYHLAQRRIWL